MLNFGSILPWSESLKKCNLFASCRQHPSAWPDSVGDTCPHLNSSSWAGRSQALHCGAETAAPRPRRLSPRLLSLGKLGRDLLGVLAELLPDLVRGIAEGRHRALLARLAVEARGGRDGHVGVSARAQHGDPRERRVLGEAAHAVDLAVGDALLPQLLDQHLAVQLHEGRLDNLVQFRAVLAPRDVGVELGVLEQVRALQDAVAEGLELALVLDGDEDRVALRLVVPVRLDGRVPQAVADRRALPVGLVVEQRDGEPVGEAAEEGGVDGAALAGVPDVDEALEHGRVGVHAHGDVGDGDAGARRPARHARQDADAGLGLHQHVVGLHVPVAAGVVRVAVA
mmetsp:Transcript_13480/g.29188  ORF Transcript_13480/g.29188 Transcript_13480/m.29188 type:complete len:340 (-) Transcript_13480:559-1578(-)